MRNLSGCCRSVFCVYVPNVLPGIECSFLLIFVLLKCDTYSKI